MACQYRGESERGGETGGVSGAGRMEGVAGGVSGGVAGSGEMREITGGSQVVTLISTNDRSFEEQRINRPCSNLYQPSMSGSSSMGMVDIFR